MVHRSLHWRPLYRRVHTWHHRSVVTTPCSAYSFHTVESFLFGSVMPLALLLHAFSPWALLGLTVMSLLLNVGGHLLAERLNQQLGPQGRELEPPPALSFDAISDGDFGIEPMPDRWYNLLDLQTAIELFTPVYQLFLTDNDFWRATNSLQFDEVIGIYVARILTQPHNLVLLNNKHPMVPESTLRAGYRLVLHGLSSEMLYELLVRAKRAQHLSRQ